jgi:hypothetical protein
MLQSGILILSIARDLMVTQLIPTPWALKTPVALHMLYGGILQYVLYSMILQLDLLILRIARDLKVTQLVLTLWISKTSLTLQMTFHS